MRLCISFHVRAEIGLFAETDVTAIRFKMIDKILKLSLQISQLRKWTMNRSESLIHEKMCNLTFSFCFNHQCLVLFIHLRGKCNAKPDSALILDLFSQMM